MSYVKTENLKKTEQNECKNTESVQLKQKILQMETITNMAHHTSHITQ